MGEKFVVRSSAPYSTVQEAVVAWPVGSTGAQASFYLTAHSDNQGGTLTLVALEGDTDTGPWVERAHGRLVSDPTALDEGGLAMSLRRRANFVRLIATPSQRMRFRVEGEWF